MKYPVQAGQGSCVRIGWGRGLGHIFRLFIQPSSNKSFNQCAFYHESYLYLNYMLQHMVIWVVTGTMATGSGFTFWRRFIELKMLLNSTRGACAMH